MSDTIGIPNEDGFFCLDSNWRFTFINRITLEFLKRNPEELTGKVIWEEYPALVGSTFEPVCRSVMEKHSAQRIEMKSHDSEAWYHIVIFPAQGGIAIYWRDITSQKREQETLAANEERMRLLLESHAQAFWETDAVGNFTSVQSSWRDYSGEIREKLFFNTLLNITHPDDRRQAERQWREALETAKNLNIEFRVKSPDGEWNWLNARAIPIRDKNGTVTKWAGMNINITARKIIEEDLRDSQEHLEALVEKLKLADENRNSFINILSHELRNPISAISMGLTLLKNASPGSEQADKAHSIMERQTGQLTRLVDDLLDVTRITQNKIELKKQRIDLNAVVYHIVADFYTQFTDKGVKLDFELEPASVWIEADPARLTQAIGNLLHNAVKFTTCGDNTKVSVKIDRENEDQVTIIVQDTGPGIDPSLLPRLFEPFVQADSSLAHSNGGLGLGLPIVKGIIELHDGKVSVSSDGVGRGSQFVIHLPLQKDNEETTEEKQLEAEENEFHSLKILIIEDIPDLAEILSELLCHLGHDAIVALNGPEGIRKAKHHLPDVLISDIGLPGMSGYEIADAFRNDDQLKNTYLIALSGYAQPEDFERSQKAGFQQHLAKPVNLEDLKRALEEAYVNKVD